MNAAYIFLTFSGVPFKRENEQESQYLVCVSENLSNVFIVHNKIGKKMT